MKQFALLDATPALLQDVNPRSEKHGKQKVPAVDLKLQVTASNTLLDQLKDDLRHGLYVAGGAEPQPQGELEGVDPLTDTPVLRVHGLQPVKFDDELTGYTVTFDIGTGRKDSVVELTGCKVSAFSVEALEGGSVKVTFRVQASGLNERQFGKLCTLIDCEVGLVMEPPAVTETLPLGQPGATSEEARVH